MPLQRIARLYANTDRAMAALRRAVISARRGNGVSWARIAAILGITKQGAMKRYAGTHKKSGEWQL